MQFIVAANKFEEWYSSMNDDTFDPRIADIAGSGRIRLALFQPQYKRTQTGDLTFHGVGLVGHALISELAQRVGIAVEVVEQPAPPETIKTLNAGGCDVIVAGFEESRTKIIEFTPPIAQCEFSYLVPPGSAIEETGEVDRKGVRIAVAEGHASWMTLKRSVRHAEIVGTSVPEEAFALVCDGGVDVFALPRVQLLSHFVPLLPGSRILSEGFGYNRPCFAVAKGQTELCSFISEFVEEAKASGLINRIIDEAGLTTSGFEVPE